MKKNLIWKAVTLIIAIIACLCFECFAINSTVVTQVQIRQDKTDLTGDIAVTLSWNQKQKGTTKVLICDLQGSIVRKLMENEVLDRGAHQLEWDGRDINGIPCSVGAYLPIIKVRTDRGMVGAYNPSASNWGENLHIETPTYDADRRIVTFTLDRPALCLLRIGEVQEGLFYGTLLNWQPKPAGRVEVAWDGMDAQKIVKLHQRDELVYELVTAALPHSAILITASPTPHGPPDGRYERFPLHPPHGNDVSLHARHRMGDCGDFNILASINNIRRKGTGNKVESGILDITVRKEDGYHRLQKEKFEIYLYVDGRYTREEKRSKLPATIQLDTTKLSNGEHLVIVGLMTLENHVGTYTMKINVEN